MPIIYKGPSIEIDLIAYLTLSDGVEAEVYGNLFKLNDTTELFEEYMSNLTTNNPYVDNSVIMINKNVTS